MALSARRRDVPSPCSHRAERARSISQVLACARSPARASRVTSRQRLELLPRTDSFVDREWGYRTSNYFSADLNFRLSERPCLADGVLRPSALVTACHRHRLRFSSCTSYGLRHSCMLIVTPSTSRPPLPPWTGETRRGSRDDLAGTLQV